MTETAQTSTTQRSARPRRNIWITVLVGSLVLLVIFGGWLLLAAASRASSEEIHAAYGQRNAMQEADSVNGTRVLADMFAERDFGVSTWGRISPKLDKFETIVWFPDEFEPPSDEARAKLEQWLANGRRRTLVYVARDYDAEIAYWELMKANAPDEQKIRIENQLTDARLRHAAQRGSLPETEHHAWFTLRGTQPKHKVDRLDGPWAEGVDASKTWLELQARIEPPRPEEGYVRVDELLVAPHANGDDVLAMRLTSPRWFGGKIIVVANGSFLLNMPLVNHEHRKLAGRLIDECGPGSVAFVESGPRPIEIRDKEPEGPPPSWARMMTVWPLGPTILHVAMWGILLCFALFPIFGRPHDLQKEPASDFGKHIESLGALLARTQNRGYAQARIAYYHEKVKRDSGAGHAESRKSSEAATGTSVS